MDRRAKLLVTAAVAALLLVVPAAHAAADIEAVWSFNGGQVAVQAQPDGSFKGTVIRPTTLASCTHPAGEEMWLDIRAQPDGQYFGRHQWFQVSDCSYIERGNTAFRVLTNASGAKFLRVCFADPAQPALQPTIAPDGTSANTTNGCDDSDLVSALPAGKPPIESIASLPKSTGKKQCRSRRSFKIRLKEPPGDALKSATITIAAKGKQLRAIRRDNRFTAPINLKGLPKGRYTVRIVATTVLGRTITGTRKYRTCATKKGKGGKHKV
jgi:hypothetical protein